MFEKKAIAFLFAGLIIFSTIANTAAAEDLIQNPPSKSDSLFSLKLASVNSDSVSLSNIRTASATVLVMLSPECPMCQNYTNRLKTLYDEYNDHGVRVYGVFPGDYYNVAQIQKFLYKYELELPALLDVDYHLTEILNATITPEAYVLDSAGQIVYSGMIDNWYYRLGKRRGVVTEQYLNDALIALLAGKKQHIKRKEPIGCFIYGPPDR